MDLLDRDVAPFMHGVLDMYRDGDCIRMKRFTDAQMAYYVSCNDRWPVRAHCNAGEFLEMKTDSRTLDLSLKVFQGAREYMGLDVEVDGAVIYSTRINPVGDTFEARLFEFEERKVRTARVYLPQSVEVGLVSVGLEDGAEVSPVDPPEMNLLCLGDSITQGMDALSPMASYTTQLARLLNANLLNQGVGGHVFDAGSFDLELPFDADLVTIAYGTNDWNGNRTEEQIRANALAYVQKVRTRYPDARIVVLSPLWRSFGMEERDGGTLLAFSNAILDAATQVDGVETIDGLTLVPHQAWLMADETTHPSDEGFLYYGVNLYRALQGT